MKIIFIAGPYTASTREQCQANILRAEVYARALARAGVGFVCPHLNTAHFDDEASYDFFLSMTMELLRRCDAVLAIPGWFESKGARAEVAQAWKHGQRVFQPQSEAILDAVIEWALTK